MSGSSTSVKSSEQGPRKGKAISYHQKMEEARRRRAEVLAGNEPANTPKPSLKKASLKIVGTPKTEPLAEHPTQPTDTAPAHQTTPEPAPIEEVQTETNESILTRPLRLIKGLFAMLAILLVAAAYQLWENRIGPAPEYTILQSASFAPPVSIGYNPKLAATQDASPARTFPAPLAAVLPDAPPAAVAPAPAPEAPAVFAADIALPPPPRPSSIVAEPSGS